MSRYIDADMVKQEVFSRSHCEYETPEFSQKDVDNIVDSIPTADVQKKVIELVNEACKMGIKALEKQIPKKRINILKMAELLGCSNCKQYLLPYCRYCPNCGQAVDWSNTE